MNFSFSGNNVVSLGATSARWDSYHAAKGTWNNMQAYRRSWQPTITFTDYVPYTIQGYPSNDKVSLRTAKIKTANQHWHTYYSRIWRNFKLDFEGSTHQQRIADLADMPAIAEKMRMMEEGTMIVDPTASLSPGGGDAPAAAQYSTDTTLVKKESNQLLKYAPAVMVGLGLFKLFFK